MAYFTRDTIRFLSDLAKNNERPWFEAHRARYDRHLKEPAARFVEDVAGALGMDGKLMRIHRDVRFSKDKSPYKTNIGISFHPRGVPKGPLVAGVYLHVAPEERFVATGCWRPEPPILRSIREAIASDPAAWRKAAKVGLDEDEEALKRAPKGFPEDHPAIADLRRRSFTASEPLSVAEVTSADLPKRLVAAEKRMRPLREFLVAAVR